MISITCDKCARLFEVDEAQADDRVGCPYCGDVNRLPGEASAAPLQVQPGIPSGSIPRGDEAEHVVRIVRQAMFRAHPFWYMVMVMVFGVGLGMMFAARSAGQAAQPWVFWAGLGIAGLAVLWWLVWWAAPHRWVKLTMTNRRTTRQEGIVMRKTSEVLHNHVRNIKIEQSVLQRLLGVGSVSIDSAGGSDVEPIEIQMNHVPDPYGVKQIIDQHRRL